MSNRRSGNNSGIQTITQGARQAASAVVQDLKSLDPRQRAAEPAKPTFDGQAPEGLYIKHGLNDGSTHIVLVQPGGKVQEATVSNPGGAWDGTWEVTKEGDLKIVTGEWSSLYSSKRNALRGYDGAAAHNGKPVDGQYMIFRIDEGK